jgi:type I restriction enzyme, S subunit
VSAFLRLSLAELILDGKTRGNRSAHDIWNLNLDQIEPDSGRILQKVRVSPDKLGPSTYQFTAGTVLYSKLRPYLNKVVVADEDGVATTELVPIRCNPKKVLPSYLAYYLRSPEFLDFAKTVVAGAKMPRMVMGEFWQYEIPVPPLSEQQRIATILDKADALRAKRRETLAQLDRLAQSVFVEMFGDLFINSKGFSVARLGDVCDVRDGTHDSPSYVADGYPLLTSKNLRDGKVDLSEVNYISETDYIEINRRSKVDTGDILMPMIGTIGNPVLVSGEPNFAIKNVALIKFVNDSPTREFVLQFLQGDCFDRLVTNRNKGGTQKFLALGEIRGLPLPIPPKLDQLDFSRRIQAIASRKKIYETALIEADLLFKSIQHRAFQGVL